MKLLIQVRADDRREVACQLECDDSTSVGEVTDLVVDRLRLRVPSNPTLSVVGRAHRSLVRTERMSQAGIRSGDVLGVRAEDPREAARGSSSALATAPAVLVVHGSTSGFGARRFPLAFGSNLVGRDAAADVVLGDAGVSRRHATIFVRDVVEVDDDGSSNGVWVAGERVQRPTRVEPGVPWSIGDLVVHVERSAVAVDRGDALDHVPFNPAPRVAARFDGREFTVPAPPAKPNRMPIPYSSMLLPIVLVAVLFMSDEPLNAMMLAFLVLSPLLVIGSVVEGWWAARRDYRQAVADHAVDVDEVLERLARAQREEVERRIAESPDAETCGAMARTLSLRLWERRADQADLLELSAGQAILPTRCQLTVESGGARAAARRLRDLPRQYARVGPVPVVLPLCEAGSVGIAGGERGRDLARALVVQAAAQHSPATVQVAAILGRGAEARWEWLKWLPHTQARGFVVDAHPLASGADPAVSLLEALDRYAAERAAQAGEERPRTRVLLVVDDEDLPLERSRFTHLLEIGPLAGVHVIWSSDRYQQLPATSGLAVLVADDGTASIGVRESGQVIADVAVDRMTVGEASAVAVALAPVVDVTASTALDEDPPERISLPVALEDLGILDDPARVVGRWSESAAESAGLPVVLGHRGRRPMLVDLRRDGPHALIAGTTGSGKSELLQSLLASLAVTHSPSRLTFLLVDYKGGAAFKDCKDLPHTVGFVTDLDNHEVHRALVSLNAELTHRERLLDEHDAKDLMEMEEKGIAATPPSLLIVVDEFAALAKEIPEFVDGVVNVAQRGRSLGLHLLLATQRPAGVITDNIRANTNLRIALRVSDAEDSVDVLGLPLAANLSRATPGRAVAKVGPGEILPFQSAYVGSHTPPGSLTSRLDLSGFNLSGARTLDLGDVGSEHTRMDAVGGATLAPSGGRTLGPHEVPGTGAPLAGSGAEPNEATDLTRIVRTTTEAVALVGMAAPRKPWLDPLAALTDLLDPSSFDGDGRSPDSGRVLVGRADHPAQQRQGDALIDLARDGGVMIFGASRSGKTALLRTIAVSAGQNAAGDPVHVYGLDFTGRGLAMLEVLPHVGSVISGEDEERVSRLLRTLRDELRNRAVAFQEAGGVSDLAEYRRAVPGADLPRIVLLVDGYAAFQQLYDASMDDLPEQMARLISEGRAVGIHVVITNDLRTGIPMKVFGAMTTKVVLRLASDEEYTNLGLPLGALSADAPPGRGYLNADEVQFALVGDGVSGEEQAMAIAAVAETMTHLAPAPAVERLEVDLRASALQPSPTPGRAVLGRSGVTLLPVELNLAEQHTVVIGPMRSGRTSTLRTLVSMGPVEAWDRRVVFSPRASALTRESVWTDVGVGTEEIVEVAGSVTSEVAGAAEPLRVLVVIDDLLEILSDFDVEDALRALHNLARTHVVRFLVAADLNGARRSGADLFVALRSANHGVLLQPEPGDGDLLGAQFRIARAGAFPVGRGYVVVRGVPELVQVAAPDA